MKQPILRDKPVRRVPKPDPPKHSADEHCTPYLDTSRHGDGTECSVCGVYHGDPCPQCNGRGFHKFDCTWETS